MKKKIGLMGRRALLGYLFIMPFILGFIFFMVKPLFQSLHMAGKRRLRNGQPKRGMADIAFLHHRVKRLHILDFHAKPRFFVPDSIFFYNKWI